MENKRRRPEDLRGKYMTVKEMGDLLGLKKTGRYWLVKKQFFQTEMIADQLRVYIPSFEKWYANQVKYRKITGEEPGLELKKRSFSVPEMAQVLDIPEYKAYEIIKENEIETEQVDFVTRIPKENFRKWYRTQDLYRTREDAAREGNIKQESISMPEMAALLGITRSKVYAILKTGPKHHLLETVMVVGRKRITRKSFEVWYGSQDTYTLLTDREQKKIADEKNKRIAAYRLNRKLRIRRNGDGNLKYLTRQEAAILAEVSAACITNWYNRGNFPVKKVGNAIRIPREEYERFLETRKERVNADRAS